jgi:hypothetical protein
VKLIPPAGNKEASDPVISSLLVYPITSLFPHQSKSGYCHFVKLFKILSNLSNYIIGKAILEQALRISGG